MAEVAAGEHAPHDAHDGAHGGPKHDYNLVDPSPWPFVGSASALAPGVYGLGTNLHAPDERLGSVALSYRNPIGDAQPMQVLTSLDNGETWTPRPNAEPKVFAGFALPGDRQPDFIRQLTTQLQVETTLNVANDLTLNQEVPLDGSIVLDLRYL